MASLIIAMVVATNAWSQMPTLNWVKSISNVPGNGNGSILTNTIDHDANGNVYMVGQFSGTVDFDPGPSVATQTSPSTRETPKSAKPVLPTR